MKWVDILRVSDATHFQMYLYSSSKVNAYSHSKHTAALTAEDVEINKVGPTLREWQVRTTHNITNEDNLLQSSWFERLDLVHLMSVPNPQSSSGLKKYRPTFNVEQFNVGSIKRQHREGFMNLTLPK
jgi:hypothetical protein